MADTYEKDLAQKSSLTTSDFIRVVGSDNVSYKQQVSNVKTAMGIWKVFDNTSLLTSQVDALSEGAHQGIIYAYSKQSETGTPVNSNFYLHIYVSNSANYKEIFAYPISATAGECYALIKRGASWDANWVHFPTRAEMDALTPKYTDVTATTTVTGAFSIPSALQSKPIIDVYPTNITAIALRRDLGYFMIKDATSMAALANTSTTLRIWHF